MKWRSAGALLHVGELGGLPGREPICHFQRYWVTKTSRRNPWAEEFYCGCWESRFPSSFCLPCSGTDAATTNVIPKTPLRRGLCLGSASGRAPCRVRSLRLHQRATEVMEEEAIRCDDASSL